MNTFQVVLASDGRQTFVLFIYAEIQWNLRNNTVVGFNAGDGERSFSLLQHLNSTDATVLERLSNVGIPGMFMFRVDQDMVMQPG